MVKNSIVSASELNKRKNAICYHRVIEAQSDATLRVGWIPGEYNIVDLFTNTTMTEKMRHRMVELIFYNKVVVIREMDKQKWKKPNQNVGPLVSNTSKYILHYQR